MSVMVAVLAEVKGVGMSEVEVEIAGEVHLLLVVNSPFVAFLLCLPFSSCRQFETVSLVL